MLLVWSGMINVVGCSGMINVVGCSGMINVVGLERYDQCCWL